MKFIVLGLCVVIAGLSGMLTYTMQTNTALETAALEETTQQELAEETDAPAPTLLATAQSGLVDELVESLQVAHEELNGSRLRLDKREKNLQELYATYLKLRQEVNGLMDDLDRRMVKVEENEMKNFKKLAGVYSKMEAGSAAKSLKHMDSERAALILSQMDSRAMASIMNEAITASSDGSEDVAEWSDALRRLNDGKGDA